MEQIKTKKEMKTDQQIIEEVIKSEHTVHNWDLAKKQPEYRLLQKALQRQREEMRRAIENMDVENTRANDEKSEIAAFFYNQAIQDTLKEIDK